VGKPPGLSINIVLPGLSSPETAAFARITRKFVIQSSQFGDRQDSSASLSSCSASWLSGCSKSAARSRSCATTLAGALLQQKLVDEVVIYMAPKLLGHQAKGLFDLGEISIMSDTIPLSIRDVRAVGNDIRIIAQPE